MCLTPGETDMWAQVNQVLSPELYADKPPTNVIALQGVMISQGTAHSSEEIALQGVMKWLLINSRVRVLIRES